MKTKNQKNAPGPFPLKILPFAVEQVTIVTNQGNHYATTFDPSAARLIAAAPDLLMGLKTLINRLEMGYTIDMMESAEKMDGEGTSVLRSCHAAISKAEGREVSK